MSGKQRELIQVPNSRGDLVRDMRICARKIQAGSLQLTLIIRESGRERIEGEKQQCKKIY